MGKRLRDGSAYMLFPLGSLGQLRSLHLAIAIATRRDLADGLL